MLFRGPSSHQIAIGLAALRLVVGAIFIAHGGQKLFVYGFDGVAGAFGQMGVPMAGIAGPFVALVEFLGGFALLLGLLTRLASLGLVSTMVGAIVLVHWPAGFFLPNGYEFALSLLGSTVLLTLTGAGGWSVDALIARRLDRLKKSVVAAPRLNARRAA